MVLVDGKVVLLDPTAGRSSKQSSSFSIGKALTEAVNAHNASLTGDERKNPKFWLDVGMKPKALSCAIHKTVQRKLMTNELFREYAGRKTFAEIRRLKPRKIDAALNDVIERVNKEHYLLSYTNNWGAHKTIVEYLRTHAARRRAKKKENKERKSDKNGKKKSSHSPVRQGEKEADSCSEDDEVELEGDEDEITPQGKDNSRHGCAVTDENGLRAKKKRNKKDGPRAAVNTKVKKSKRSMVDKDSKSGRSPAGKSTPARKEDDDPRHERNGNDWDNLDDSNEDPGDGENGPAQELESDEEDRPEANVKQRKHGMKRVKRGKDLKLLFENSEDDGEQMVAKRRRRALNSSDDGKTGKCEGAGHEDARDEGKDSGENGKFCVLKDCKIPGPPVHECKTCHSPMHNICGQNELGLDNIDGIYLCSFKCMVGYMKFEQGKL